MSTTIFKRLFGPDFKEAADRVVGDWSSKALNPEHHDDLEDLKRRFANVLEFTARAVAVEVRRAEEKEDGRVAIEGYVSRYMEWPRW